MIESAKSAVCDDQWPSSKRLVAYLRRARDLRPLMPYLAVGVWLVVHQTRSVLFVDCETPSRAIVGLRGGNACDVIDCGAGKGKKKDDCS